MAKIMVIDDDQKIRQIISRFLEQKGYQVILVPDGSFGMEAIRNERPDLIILDVLMPGLDGCALGHHLKFESEFSHIPIIMLSSLTHRSYLAEDIAAECFMTKPFSGEALVAKVDEILKSGIVKVRPRRTKPRPPSSTTKIVKKKVFGTPITGCFALLTLLMILYGYYSSPAIGQTAMNTSGEAKEIGLLADKMFIGLIPVCLGALAYMVYLMKQTLSVSLKEAGNVEIKKEKHSSRR